MGKKNLTCENALWEIFEEKTMNSLSEIEGFYLSNIKVYLAVFLASSSQK
jgi:hypothetical protein